MARSSATRDIVLSAVNATGIPLHRESIARIVHEEYQLEVTDHTIYKWLLTLVKQGRIVRILPGMYCSHEVAQAYREEERNS